MIQYHEAYDAPLAAYEFAKEHGQLGLPIPEDTKLAVYRRSNGQCEDCGHTPCEYHHTNYEHCGRETPEDLNYLCRYCHKRRHIYQGEWFNDPDRIPCE